MQIRPFNVKEEAAMKGQDILKRSLRLMWSWDNIHWPMRLSAHQSNQRTGVVKT